MIITHSACNIVYRQGRDELEFLVLDYQCLDPVTQQLTSPEVRFPAGTSESGEFGESEEETSVRKLAEETGLMAVETERIAKKKTGTGHIKLAFLISVEHCLGEIREGSFEINGDRMSSLRWLPASQIKPQIAPCHHWAYRAAVERLRREVWPRKIFT